MNTLYLIVGGVVILVTIGWVLLKSKKNEGALEVKTQDADATNVVLKKELDIANKPMTPAEAYSELLKDGEKK